MAEVFPQIDLATAMAISGAAAIPNTGVGGTGLTRRNLWSINAYSVLKIANTLEIFFSIVLRSIASFPLSENQSSILSTNSAPSVSSCKTIFA